MLQQQPAYGLPSPAPAPVFRTPTHPASRIRNPAPQPSSQSSAAKPTRARPQHDSPSDDENGGDDVEEGDDDSEYESEEEAPSYGLQYGTPMFAPWSPRGSFIPPPSPLFPSFSAVPNFGFGTVPTASPGFGFAAPPSPVADVGSMMWSAFYAGFFAGQQQSAHSTPMGTPKRKRRKLS